MGRLKFLIVMTVVCSLSLSAQNVNTDIKTTEQLLLNTAMQEGVEILHNQQVDSVKQRQNKLAELTASYAALKDIFVVTLENAKGFGPESGVYKSIVNTSLSIVSHLEPAATGVLKSNLRGKIIAITRITDLVKEAAHLGNMFFDIVNNAEIQNPMASKMSGAEASQKDKYNLLNRHERLAMALQISIELKKLDRQLVMIIYYCHYNSLSDLLLNLDRKTWVTYNYSNFMVKRLIKQWNSLVK